MSQLYDYEKYYKPMKATAKVKLDLSGLPLKTLASIQDEEGETTLNERVTNNVMEYVQKITAAASTGSEVMLLGNVASATNRVIHLHWTTTTAGSTPENTDVFVAAGFVADDLVKSGIVKANTTPYRRKPDTLVNGQAIRLPDDGPSDTHSPLAITLETYTADSPFPVVTAVSSVTFEYIPRYLLMVDKDTLQQSQNFSWINNVHVYRAALGCLGFDRVREHGRKWFTKTAPKDRKAITGYDALQKTLKYMSPFYNDGGMGLEVVYYDDKFKQPVTVDAPTREEWQLDRNAARAKLKAHMRDAASKDLGYTLTSMKGSTKFSALGSMLGTDSSGWINEKNRIYAEVADSEVVAQGGEVDYSKKLVSSLAGTEETGGTGTALIPNVCDAFKAFYYSKEELRSMLADALTETADEFKNAHGTPGSARAALRSFFGAVAESAFLLNTDGVGKYALDLGEIRRSLYTVGRSKQDYAGIGYYVDDDTAEISLRLRALSIRGANEYATDYTGYDTKDGYGRNVPVIAGPACLYANKGGRNVVWAGSVSETDFWKYHPTMYYDGINTYEDYIREKVSSKVDASYIKAILLAWYVEWVSNVSTKNSSSISIDQAYSRIWESVEDFDRDSSFVRNHAAVKATMAKYPYAGGMISVARAKVSSISYDYVTWYVGGGYITARCDITAPDGSLYTVGAGNDAAHCRMNSINYATFYSPYGFSVYTLAQFATEAAILIRGMRDASASGTVANVHSWYPVNDNWKLTGEFTVLGVDETEFPLGEALFNTDGKRYVTGLDYYAAAHNQYDDDIDLNDVDVSMPYFVDTVMWAYKKMLAGWRDWLDDLKVKLFAGSLIGGAAAAAASVLEFTTRKEEYEDAKDAFGRLKTAIERIRYYEYITHESVFNNKSSMYGGFAGLNFKMVPARFMVAVSMYKKVRKRYRRFGFTRHRMVKQFIGIRWAEVRMIDTNIYSEYPQLVDDTYTVYPVGQTATITGNSTDGYVVTVPSAIEGEGDAKPGDISGQAEVVLDLMASDGYVYSYGATPDGDLTYYITDDDFVASDFASGATLLNVKVPLPASKDDDSRTTVELRYDMPSLPRASEIRHRAFVDYGPFDQSRYAIVDRAGDVYKGHMDGNGKFIYDTDKNGNLIPVVDRVDGWRIFHESSMNIADMRKGMGVFDAAASLLGILRAEFGDKRVELCETMRSAEDEAQICSGGPESAFLSWHNYGLGIKILIYQDDLRTPIAEDSDDFRKLIDIAEAFTEDAREAKVCPKPLNVVWCGRLVMGANIFCWEFLPIGVEHRDAPKFREALLERMDPVERCSFVNVDAKGYVTADPPKDRVPYILSGSETYRDAEQVNGQHYVDPVKVVNYVQTQVHHDLPLINVIEFIKMMQLKMAANGSTLTDRANIYEWKSVNETAFRQLVMYFGMVGNLSGAQSLISGDFVESYQTIVDMYYTTDIVEFVKAMLGNLYSSAKVFLTDVGDGGAYISLADGHIHVFGESTRSAYDQNYGGNVFGERQVTPAKLVRGIERDGVFYTVEEAKALGMNVEYVSDGPVLSGYTINADGSVTIDGGDAQLLHALAASQIKEQYEKLKSRFEDYGGAVMYDHFADGPNANNADMLENEFGIIAGQTLMSFDALRAMVDKSDINGSGNTLGTGAGKLSDDSYGDLDGNGNPLESVFEKVVSNAQLSGVRLASLTREHVTEIPRSNGLSVERIYAILTNGKKVMGNDLMRRK